MGKEARKKRDRRKKDAKKKAAKRETTRTVHLDDETSAALRQQFGLFEERFGRPPGPNDPVFFDPDFDIPTPITPVKAEAVLVEGMQKAGIDPAYIYAYQQTGMLVTEMNRDQFKKKELVEFREAMDRYERVHGPTPTLEDLRGYVAAMAGLMVDLILQDDGERFFGILEEMPREEDDGLTVGLLIATLMSWLVQARDCVDLSDEEIEKTVAAARSRLSRMEDPVDAVAGLLRRGSTETVAEMIDRVQDDDFMLVAMTMLVASLATVRAHETVRGLFADLGIQPVVGDDEGNE